MRENLPKFRLKLLPQTADSRCGEVYLYGPGPVPPYEGIIGLFQAQDEGKMGQF
jgi:hypothetical protein